MGSFDDFVADDDDVTANPVAKEAFSSLATGHHGKLSFSFVFSMKTN
jgi:hypothetical protein